MNIFFRKLIVAGLISYGAAATAQEITGAGATFPAPVYAKWAEAYQKATSVKMNYQSIGSSGGIRQINAKTVDFGASDAPLSNGHCGAPSAVTALAAMTQAIEATTARRTTRPNCAN